MVSRKILSPLPAPAKRGSIKPMFTHKRFLSLKTICLVATILFLVACYFAARKVMVWDVELGMTRAEVIKVLGEPTESQGWFPDAWERTIFNQSIYSRITGIYYDADGKADAICVMHQIFGRQFMDTRTLLPLH
jgi:hypothetical protein